MAYPPTSSTAFATSSSSGGNSTGFFKKLFKGGDRTGIRTTLTRRQVFTIAAITVGIVIGIALTVGLTLVDKGVSAKAGILPVYPAQSFPNQYSMLTGLYPANHGIIGDYFHVPDVPSNNGFNRFTTFARNESGTVNQPIFWGGVPLWVTIRRNNLDVGTHPPTYDQPFNRSQTDRQRVVTLVSWIKGVNLLTNSVQPKPVFIATHFRDADANGTLFGPDVNSPNFREVLARVDSNFGFILDQIEEIGMTNSIDVVVTSDHGISPTPNNASFHLFYEDFLDLSQVDIVQNRPLTYVYPKSTSFDLNAFAETMRNRGDRVRTYIKGRTDSFAEGYTFFYRNESFPDRISLNRNQLGSGGYDVDLPNMLGIFAARGPSFKIAGKLGGDKPEIKTVDMYPLLAKLVGVEPEKSDGRIEVFKDYLK
ncbi:alkaline-phosphatase-like protein [Chytridium lagenaria]|nr:alkaline-phosphatase-like protein [Chytridium lagenaria]